MPRRDETHDIVRTALEQEGWTVTHDPFYVKIGNKSGQIDLGAEKVIVAERESEKIAVEVKSFNAPSTLTDFYHALGQFLLYQYALQKEDPDRILYLALPIDAYTELSDDIFDFPHFSHLRHHLLVFDPTPNAPLLWIK